MAKAPRSPDTLSIPISSCQVLETNDTEFVPFGTGLRVFSGTISGEYHKISGINYTAENGAGLIINATNAHIENIVIANSSFTAQSYAAAVAAHSRNTVIENVQVEASVTITAQYFAGGIASEVLQGGSIMNVLCRAVFTHTATSLPYGIADLEKSPATTTGNVWFVTGDTTVQQGARVAKMNVFEDKGTLQVTFNQTTHAIVFSESSYDPSFILQFRKSDETLYKNGVYFESAANTPVADTVYARFTRHELQPGYVPSGDPYYYIGQRVTVTHQTAYGTRLKENFTLANASPVTVTHYDNNNGFITYTISYNYALTGNTISAVFDEIDPTDASFAGYVSTVPAVDAEITYGTAYASEVIPYSESYPLGQNAELHVRLQNVMNEDIPLAKDAGNYTHIFELYSDREVTTEEPLLIYRSRTAFKIIPLEITPNLSWLYDTEGPDADKFITKQYDGRISPEVNDTPIRVLPQTTLEGAYIRAEAGFNSTTIFNDAAENTTTTASIQFFVEGTKKDNYTIDPISEVLLNVPAKVLKKKIYYYLPDSEIIDGVIHYNFGYTGASPDFDFESVNSYVTGYRAIPEVRYFTGQNYETDFGDEAPTVPGIYKLTIAPKVGAITVIENEGTDSSVEVHTENLYEIYFTTGRLNAAENASENAYLHINQAALTQANFVLDTSAPYNYTGGFVNASVLLDFAGHRTAIPYSYVPDPQGNPNVSVTLLTFKKNDIALDPDIDVTPAGNYVVSLNVAEFLTYRAHVFTLTESVSIPYTVNKIVQPYDFNILVKDENDDVDFDDLTYSYDGGASEFEFIIKNYYEVADTYTEYPDRTQALLTVASGNAIINAAGKVVFTGAGTTVIRATSAENANYLSTVIEIALDVKKSTETVTVRLKSGYPAYIDVEYRDAFPLPYVVSDGAQRYGTAIFEFDGLYASDTVPSGFTSPQIKYGANTSFNPETGILNSLETEDGVSAYEFFCENDFTSRDYETVEFESAAQLTVLYLSVYKKQITVKADNKTTVYGNISQPALTASLFDKNGVPTEIAAFTPVVVLNGGEQVVNAGTYTLSVNLDEISTGLTANYKFSKSDANYVVEKRTVSTEITGTYYKVYQKDAQEIQLSSVRLPLSSQFKSGETIKTLYPGTDDDEIKEILLECVSIAAIPGEAERPFGTYGVRFSFNPIEHDNYIITASLLPVLIVLPSPLPKETTYTATVPLGTLARSGTYELEEKDIFTIDGKSYTVYEGKVYELVYTFDGVSFVVVYDKNDILYSETAGDYIYYSNSNTAEGRFARNYGLTVSRGIVYGGTSSVTLTNNTFTLQGHVFTLEDGILTDNNTAGRDTYPLNGTKFTYGGTNYYISVLQGLILSGEQEYADVINNMFTIDEQSFAFSEGNVLRAERVVNGKVSLIEKFPFENGTVEGGSVSAPISGGMFSIGNTSYFIQDGHVLVSVPVAPIGVTNGFTIGGFAYTVNNGQIFGGLSPVADYNADTVGIYGNYAVFANDNIFRIGGNTYKIRNTNVYRSVAVISGNAFILNNVAYSIRTSADYDYAGNTGLKQMKGLLVKGTEVGTVTSGVFVLGGKEYVIYPQNLVVTTQCLTQAQLKTLLASTIDNPKGRFVLQSTIAISNGTDIYALFIPDDDSYYAETEFKITFTATTRTVEGIAPDSVKRFAVISGYSVDITDLEEFSVGGITYAVKDGKVIIEKSAQPISSFTGSVFSIESTQYRIMENNTVTVNQRTVAIINDNNTFTLDNTVYYIASVYNAGAVIRREVFRAASPVYGGAQFESVAGGVPTAEVVYTGRAVDISLIIPQEFGNPSWINVTYNGVTTLPVNAGTYNIVISSTSAVYLMAEVSAKLVILPKTITLITDSFIGVQNFINITTIEGFTRYLNLSSTETAANVLEEYPDIILPDASQSGEVTVGYTGGKPIANYLLVIITGTAYITPSVYTSEGDKEAHEPSFKVSITNVSGYIPEDAQIVITSLDTDDVGEDAYNSLIAKVKVAEMADETRQAYIDENYSLFAFYNVSGTEETRYLKYEIKLDSDVANGGDLRVYTVDADGKFVLVGSSLNGRILTFDTTAPITSVIIMAVAAPKPVTRILGLTVPVFVLVCIGAAVILMAAAVVIRKNVKRTRRDNADAYKIEKYKEQIKFMEQKANDKKEREKFFLNE
ncbi:MAG: hypothetical protein LBN25_01040 [Christensenellaceae bacterium]|jgi:hypothetical protein|nr:hypothetical protein [Christensenellaceae bacterium]